MEDDMKKMPMIALAAIATAGGVLGDATPASAQHWRREHHYHGGWYGPGVSFHVGPPFGYGYYGYPYGYGCRTRWRWDPYVRAYVRVRYCY
jgi:hypothetical protein